MRKFGAAKFKALPKAQKKVYIDAYKADYKEYKGVMVEKFGEKLKLRKKTKRKRVKQRKQKPLKAFTYYCSQVNKENKLSFFQMRKTWRELPSEEKGRYINELINLETNEEKKITPTDIKLLRIYQGEPRRPPNPFHLFVQNFRAGYKGDTKVSA